jgi:hypothetical protein
MGVQTIGEGYQAGWRIHARRAWRRPEGMKSVADVWTFTPSSGPAVRLSRSAALKAVSNPVITNSGVENFCPKIWAQVLPASHAAPTTSRIKAPTGTVAARLAPANPGDEKLSWTKRLRRRGLKLLPQW